MEELREGAPDAACLEKRVAFVTLGCAKNEVDTARMKEAVTLAGYTVCEEPDQAQCVVVNTCSFIQDATEESLDAIFEVAGLPNVAQGNAKVIVAGCMPARYGADLEQELAEAHAFLPCSKEDDIAALVERLIGKPAAAQASQYSYQPTAGAYSTYVKISDGCDRFCSYCTIPYIRGRYHSFTYETIKANVQRAVSNNVAEVVLIAQDTGRWGADFEEKLSLAWLMEQLACDFPQTWFRVMYVQPEGVTDELLGVMARYNNICSYLDIPLQHVNASILRAMNRHGSREEFEALIARIRAAVPGITLRTTLIAGFPGETEEQFQELCDFVEDCDFDYIGVFPYSQEEGTRAADMPNQLSLEEKQERAQTVRDIADAVSTAHIAQRQGLEMDVLIEGLEVDGQPFGRAQCQAPEVDGVVYVEGAALGSILRVRITDTLFYEMEGELL